MQKTTLRPSPDALLNPRYDANFKAIFTEDSDEGRLALKSFLEAVLNAEVSDIQLVQNELPIESEHDKQSVFDITCTLNGEKPVNIEMQGLNIDNSYDRRAEYQVAHLLNHNMKRGMDWRDVPEVFQISVLNFVYDREAEEGVSLYTMRTADGRSLSDRMSILFVELPKFRGGGEAVEDLTSAEKWCKFLLYADDGTRQELVRKICKSDGGIMAASGILSKISQDDINWARQTSIDLWERDQLTIKNYVEEAKQDLKSAKQELNNAQRELQNTKGELQNTKGELQNTQEELQNTQEELQNTKGELQNTQEELKDAQGELKDTQGKLKDTQGELQNTKEELQNTRKQAKESAEKAERELKAAFEKGQEALAEKDAQLLAQMREIELLRAKLANANVAEKL